MNSTVYTIFREYLDKTQQDPAAAAALTLADVMQGSLDAQGPSAPQVQSPEQPWTVPEVARRLRVMPQKILRWIREGVMPATNVAARATGRPRFRISREQLDAFQQTRAARPVAAKAATRRRPPPAFPPTRHSQT